MYDEEPELMQMKSNFIFAICFWLLCMYIFDMDEFIVKITKV